MTLVRVGAYDDWPTLGWEVIDWVEDYLTHGPGDVVGAPFELDREEAQLLRDLYRIYPRGHEREGQRVVGRALYSRPKGRRKSELAGAIVCAEALGPVRFGGWDANGNPVGVRVSSPFIRCLATEEEQSGNTYDNVSLMLSEARERHPDVFGGVDIGKNAQASSRVYLPTGGEIRPSTSASASKDGGKETFVVADEEHLYTTPQLKAMHRTVSRNLVKRKAAQPWLLGTTTAHRPGLASTAELAYDRAMKIAEGKDRPAPGFYFNYRFGKVSNFDDDAQVSAALKEAYWDASEWIDLDRILKDEIRNPEAEEFDSRRYFLNEAASSAEDAFSPDDITAATVEPVAVKAKTRITLGFDGSRFDDTTAIVATDVETGYQWLAGIWECPPSTEDWQVPEDEVHNKVEELFRLYRVDRFYCDPYYWETAIERWAGKWGKRVIHWHTNRDRQMALAVAGYLTALRGGEVTLEDDPLFLRHFANARRRDGRVRDDNGRLLYTIKKDRPGSPRKIDAAMAAILSWQARTDALAKGSGGSRVFSI